MFKLPNLPFEHDALLPGMSAETLKLHHGGHHRAYVEALNAKIADTPFAAMTLEAIIAATRAQRNAQEESIFQNAAQHWNHSTFWRSLSPGGEKPGRGLAALIARDFGSFEGLRKRLHEAGMDHFGSGWLWLVLRGAALDVVTTHDAETPLGTGVQVLLCCDLWEHAYYLDHRNRRSDYLNSFIERLANWAFAEAQLTPEAQQAGTGSGHAGNSADAVPPEPAASEPAPDPRAQFQSPEMLVASETLNDEEKWALLQQWNLDLDNRLNAEAEGMSASDPMNYRKESRLADEAGRVQHLLSELAERLKQPDATQS